jgi:hypothetical protein
MPGVSRPDVCHLDPRAIWGPSFRSLADSSGEAAHLIFSLVLMAVTRRLWRWRKRVLRYAWMPLVLWMVWLAFASDQEHRRPDLRQSPTYIQVVEGRGPLSLLNEGRVHRSTPRGRPPPTGPGITSCCAYWNRSPTPGEK